MFGGSTGHISSLVRLVFDLTCLERLDRDPRRLLSSTIVGLDRQTKETLTLDFFKVDS